MPLSILSPCSDFIFKLIFADLRNTDILTDFLQSVLDLPESEYDSLSIVDPHLKRKGRKDKLGVLDVKIHTTSGNVIDVEIQVADDTPMEKRIVYYVSKMITEQMSKGGDYSSIKRAISVVITNFVMINDSENYHNMYRFYDIKSGSQLTDLAEINTLELPKLPGKADKTELWNWLKFFRANKEEELKMLATKSPQIKKAVGILMELSADERTRLLYEEREKLRMDEAARIANAVQKAREEVLRVAEDNARVAESKAKLEGKLEGKLEMARKALSKNMSVEDVMDMSGLSRSEVENLR